MTARKRCAAEGCDNGDATGRFVSIGYGAWCRLFLCDDHGRWHHPDNVPPFASRRTSATADA